MDFVMWRGIGVVVVPFRERWRFEVLPVVHISNSTVLSPKQGYS